MMYLPGKTAPAYLWGLEIKAWLYLSRGLISGMPTLLEFSLQERRQIVSQ